jgi:hypothetical protein
VFSPSASLPADSSPAFARANLAAAARSAAAISYSEMVAGCSASGPERWGW